MSAHDPIIVIKFGGAAMEDPSVLESVANDIAVLVQEGHQIVVVHGGGKAVNRWIERVGLEPQFIDGRRVTDANAIELIEMVLSGSSNKDLASALSRRGVNALGISGRDSQLLEMKQTPRRELGFVGEMVRVRSEILRSLLRSNFTPVISTIGSSAEGETLNMNADDAAADIAAALSAKAVYYLTDVDGILIDGKTVAILSLNEARNLLVHPAIQGGMKPKLLALISAVEHGAERAAILNGTTPGVLQRAVVQSEKVGTQILRAASIV